ncbi:unnamed protein product [Cercospora beticola]|nr:unnamed protein product [Cercospora beticola]
MRPRLGLGYRSKEGHMSREEGAYRAPRDVNLHLRCCLLTLLKFSVLVLDALRLVQPLLATWRLNLYYSRDMDESCELISASQKVDAANVLAHRPGGRSGPSGEPAVISVSDQCWQRPRLCSSWLALR